MATEISIVRTQASTLGGNQDITSADITDFSAAIGFMFGATSAGTSADHARYCVGFCVEDAQGTSGTAKATCLSSNARDGVDNVTANVTRASLSSLNTSARFLMLSSPSAPLSTVVAAANAIDRTTSGVANGVRLNWTTTPDAAYEMVFILFGGLAGQDLASLLTTNTWGFEVEAGFVLDTSGSFGTGDGSTNNDAQFNFGAFSTGIDQGAIGVEWDRDLVDPISDADARVYTTKCIGTVAGGTASTGAAITAISSTETTCTNPQGVCLALSFSDAVTVGVAVESIPSATGVTNFTGLGFTPGYALGFATGVDASDTTTDGATAASEGLFAFDLAGAAYAGSVRLDEGVDLAPALSDASTRFDTKALLLIDDTGAVVTEATSPAGVSNGFSLNFASAGAGRMIVFGLQLPTVIQVFTETVSIADGIVSVLARTAVTSETVSIADQGLLFEQDASMAGPDEPRRGLIVSGGVARGDIATGGAEAGLVVSSPG